jgi:hypothetical protein
MLLLAVAERAVVVVRFLGACCLLFVAVAETLHPRPVVVLAAAEALVLVLGLGLVDASAIVFLV